MGDSLPIDMLLSAVSVLVVAQWSSEVPEGLMNNPVFNHSFSVTYFNIGKLQALGGGTWNKRRSCSVTRRSCREIRELFLGRGFEEMSVFTVICLLQERLCIFPSCHIMQAERTLEDINLDQPVTYVYYFMTSVRTLKWVLASKITF